MASGQTWTERNSPAYNYHPPPPQAEASSREQAESLQALEDFLKNGAEFGSRPPNQSHSSAHKEMSRYVGRGAGTGVRVVQQVVFLAVGMG